MVKGVNRQIIEITDFNSNFYERALLIVKPECSYLEEDILKKEAKYLLNNFDAPYFSKSKNKFFYWLLRLGGAAVIGAGLTLAAIFI